MRKFDLEAAKAGAKVCTRDGRKTRILCFDAKGQYPIIVLVMQEAGFEVPLQFNLQDAESEFFMSDPEEPKQNLDDAIFNVSSAIYDVVQGANTSDLNYFLHQFAKAIREEGR